MAELCNTCLRTVPRTIRGMCRKCNRSNDRSRRPPATERYPAEYRKNRAILLAGDPACYWCGKPATTADHYPVKRVDGGSHGLENLVPACAKCNSGRG